MSPERISGEEYSFNSDVWSLGIVGVEAVLGRYPYRALAPPLPAFANLFFDLIIIQITLLPFASLLCFVLCAAFVDIRPSPPPPHTHTDTDTDTDTYTDTSAPSSTLSLSRSLPLHSALCSLHSALCSLHMFGDHANWPLTINPHAQQ